MRLLTWNVAGRVARQPEQAAAVAAAGADVVALQEVTAWTFPLWRAALADAGLGEMATALEGLPATPGRRPLGVLTAARESLEPLASPEGLPWPERVLCCTVGGVEIVNVHSPIAPAPDLAKVRMHEAVAAYIASTPPGRRVVCGDLNTPRRELPDGDVLTFAHDSAGRLRPERGERWDRAERALVHALRESGWVMPSVRCMATGSVRRAGRSRATAAAGGSTTCSPKGCGRWRAPTRTIGAAAGSATTRRSSPTSRPEAPSDHSARVADLAP